MSEKPKKQDEKQIPMTCWTPPEDPLPTGEELEAKCRPEVRESTQLCASLCKTRLTP
jgi:ADP-ribose pyrophosphatase YjhB (NUDIX family)